MSIPPSGGFMVSHLSQNLNLLAGGLPPKSIGGIISLSLMAE